MSPSKKRPSPLETSSITANTPDPWNHNLSRSIPSSTTTPSALLGPLSSNIYSPRSIFQFDFAFQKSASSSGFQHSYSNSLLLGPGSDAIETSPAIVDHGPVPVREGDGLWKFSITLSPTVIESCGGGGLAMPTLGPVVPPTSVGGKITHETDGQHDGQQNKPQVEHTTATLLDCLDVLQPQKPVNIRLPPGPEHLGVGPSENNAELSTHDLSRSGLHPRVAAAAADTKFLKREITPTSNGLQWRNAQHPNLNPEEYSWLQPDNSNLYSPCSSTTIFSPISWGVSDANLASSSWHQSTLLVLSGTPNMCDRSMGGQILMHDLEQKSDVQGIPGCGLEPQALSVQSIQQSRPQGIPDQQQQLQQLHSPPGLTSSQPPPNATASFHSHIDGSLTTALDYSSANSGNNFFNLNSTTVIKPSEADLVFQPQFRPAANPTIDQPLQRSSSIKKKAHCICMQKKHACRTKSKKIPNETLNHVKKKRNGLTPSSKESFKSSYDQMIARLAVNPEFATACMKNKKGLYTCSHCSIRFPSILKFAKHLHQYDVKRAYRCDDQNCPWYYVGFFKAPEWKRHISCQHKLPNQYPCASQNCSKTFSRKDSLRRHMLLVHEMRAVME